jgi:hypothetical protein
LGQAPVYDFFKENLRISGEGNYEGKNFGQLDKQKKAAIASPTPDENPLSCPAYQLLHRGDQSLRKKRHAPYR